jgi:hyaluronan synthase
MDAEVTQSESPRELENATRHLPIEGVVDGDQIELPKVIPLRKVTIQRPEGRSAQPSEDATPLWQRRLFFGLAALAALSVLFLKKLNVDYYWYEPATNTYSLLVVTYMLSRFVLAIADRRRYPYERPLKRLPGLSIIIAAKNEEQAIYETIRTAYAADYPPELREVIVVNDGSTDRTLDEMRRAKEAHPDLSLISFAVNRGKRHCMAAAAQRARGEIVVFVDSDSFLAGDALKEIVRPFADQGVAAVSGRTDVANWSVNALTKMQTFRYYIAFKLLKAAESLFGSVTCCPGCFSAYRRSALQPILGRWLNQKFLGVSATFGDDRSLTTFLLRSGYEVKYHDRALCTTIVPEHWPHYLRQQARWKKSWVRETLIVAAFIWKRHPVMSASFYLAALFPFITPLITFHNLVYQPAWNHRLPLFYAIGLVLMCSIFSFYYRAKRNDGVWGYGFLYSLLYVLVLVWQMPYAILTLRRNTWGTR